MTKPDVLSELRKIGSSDDLNLYTPDLCKRAADEIERLRQERGRLFVWLVDQEQLEKSRPSEEYYHPKSEAIKWGLRILAEGTDVSIEERDALRKHDEEQRA